MHLISALSAGVRGADSGHVELYKRGTATRADWYSAFEGGAADSSGDNIGLDSNGRPSTSIYVNEQVRVLVKDANGTTVADFVDGMSAPSVEVISQSFTGNDYDDSDAGASKPTDLNAMADLWLTKNGAIDWQVLFNGAATTIQAALGALQGLVYNVKESTYGAAGDSTTDDTSAIQAAIDAANAAGGGWVFFPKGTYITTSALTLKDKVSLVGVGPNGSVISLTSGSADVIDLSAVTSPRTVISDLKAVHTSASSGSILDFGEASADVLVHNCELGSSVTTGIIVKGSGAAESYVKLSGCWLTYGGTTNDVIDCSGTTGRWRIEDCHFTPPATGTLAAFIKGKNVDIAGCRFKTATATGGTIVCYESSDTSAVDATMVGCHVEDSGGATVTCIMLGAYDTDAHFYENANRFPSYTDSNTTAYSYTANTGEGAQVHLGTRERRVQHVSESGTSMTPDIDQYGIIVVTHTHNSSGLVFNGKAIPDGASGAIVVYRTGTGTQGANPDDESTTVDGFKTGIVGAATLGNGGAICFPYTSVMVNATACQFIAMDAFPAEGLP
jgi:hypothetical protein